MKRVLFIGDINVDVMMGGMQSLPVVDREITCESFTITVGSAAAVCACAYASLGGSAGFLGLAGEDEYGDYMVNTMRDEFKIDTGLVRRTSRVKTGVTVNLVYQNTRTQITYPGTISEFNGADVGQKELTGFAHIHFAGPYQQTKFRPHISRILGVARTMNISTSLDPQWDASERWEQMDEWLPLVSYLFVNEGEAMSLAKAKSLDDACRALAGRTRCAVVKAGKLGSMVMDRGTIVKIPTREVAVVDTTGAGDSFDAGFLYGTFEKNLPLIEAMKIGNATGSRSCMFTGGVGHRSTYAEVLKLIEKPR